MARNNVKRHRGDRDDCACLHVAHGAFAPVPLRDFHHYYGLPRPGVPAWSDLGRNAVAVMVVQAVVVVVLLVLESALLNTSRCDSVNVAVNCTVESAQISRPP
jgi:hypothetical protein